MHEIGMDKRTEELKALANIMLVVACIGLVMCCFPPNKVVGLLGVGLVAVGFIGGIAFDSLAEMYLKDETRRKEQRLKNTIGKMDETRGVTYKFLDYLADNGCTLQEFIRIYDDLNLNINYVYDQYQHCAKGEVIQTRQQVSDIIRLERKRMYETA